MECKIETIKIFYNYSQQKNDIIMCLKLDQKMIFDGKYFEVTVYHTSKICIKIDWNLVN